MNKHVEPDLARSKAADINETTKTAVESTMLNPRFYTTDFDEMDRLDVSGVREEWDELIAEMRSDPNKGHFKRNADWDQIDIDALPDELRRSSSTSWSPR
jgi:magnesium-protoporphyrin IX monomethyl ester (oxidative) cyclase